MYVYTKQADDSGERGRGGGLRLYRVGLSQEVVSRGNPFKAEGPVQTVKTSSWKRENSRPCTLSLSLSLSLYYLRLLLSLSLFEKAGR